MEDRDREYPDVVVTAMDHLINFYKAQDKIGPDEIERTVTFMQASFPDVIDERRAVWLRRDLQDLVGGFWDLLTGPKSRGRRRENILGILRQ